MAGYLTEDLQFRGDVTFSGSVFLPSGQVTSTNFSANTAERLAATKAIHQFPLSVELAEQGTAVVAIEKLIHIVQGAACTIHSMEAAVVTVATGADRTVDIDLQRSTGGGAFATVLSSTLQIDNADSALTPYAATLSSTSLVDGDILKLTVAVAGAAGAQALGLICTVFLREDPA